MNRAKATSAICVVEPARVSVSPEAAAVSFSRATDPAILESSLNGGGYDRFSIFACDPVEVFIARPGECPFRALARCIDRYPVVRKRHPEVPFAGGWIGFFSYEAGLTVERLQPTTVQDVALPSARFCLYDAVAVFDHGADQWWLAAVDWPAPLADARPSVDARLTALRRRLESAGADPLPEPSPATSSPCVANMSRGDYLARVERAKQYIAAGDIYQVNLSQRFTTRTHATATDVYRSLRSVTPSSHAAFLSWDDTAILSASPELFLDLRAGHVVTRPIKGTRPRIGDRAVDLRARRELQDSRKDRAELTMIVDLLRNDLGRVCSYGRVRVVDAGSIEEHPTVFHRVATIEGELAPGRNWLDLLLATFPGGSITGTPKIRAMQIIDELEPTARGVYCGSIGWIGLDGSMSLNIAIRTMVQVRDRVHVYAGGAIVADSTPEGEYDEMLTKAAGMLRALGCASPSALNKAVMS